MLCAVDPIREMVVRRDAIELRRRLIQISRKSFSAVIRDLSAAIVRDDHSLCVFRIDPQIMVIAVWCVDRAKRLAAIRGMPKLNIDHVDFVDIFRAGVNTGIVPCPLSQIAIFVHALPCVPTVLAAKQATIVGFDDCPHAVRIHRGNCNADDADGSLRQTGLARDLRPRVSSVDTLPQSRSFAATLQTVRRSQHSPRRSINHSRIVGVEDEVNRADFVVDKQNFLPSRPSISRAKHAAFWIRSVQVPHRRDVNQVWIARMNSDSRDVT